MSNSSATLESSVKRPWFTYGVLLFGLFAIMLILGMITPVLPYISKDLQINSAYTAYVSVLYTLGAAVLAPMMGRLGDLFGMKRILTLGLFLFACGCLCIGIAPSLPVVLAGRFLRRRFVSHLYCGKHSFIIGKCRHITSLNPTGAPARFRK